MTFTRETLNAFQMTGRMAACEVPARREGCRGFVAVYPPSSQAPHWTIRRFEIDSAWLERGYDVSDEEMQGLDVLHLADLESVERALADWGVDPAAFGPPWRTDGPF
jgi:hypothetical protein